MLRLTEFQKSFYKIVENENNHLNLSTLYKTPAKQ